MDWSTSFDTDTPSFETQMWCKSNFADFITTFDRPPSSPNLYLLDYSFCGILEPRVEATRHTNIDSLESTLLGELDDFLIDGVRAVIHAWSKLLKAVVKEIKGRFE